FHAAQQVAHTAAVELEDTQGVATGEELVGLLVVQVQGGHVNVHPFRLLDAVDRVIDDGQVAQTQKVHLEQTHVLALRVGKGRDDGAVGVTLVQRDDVQQRVTRKDDARGVHTRAPCQALDAPGGLHDLGDLRVVVDQVA